MFFITLIVYLKTKSYSVEKNAIEILNESYRDFDVDLELFTFRNDIKQELNKLHLYINSEFASYDDNYQRII